MAHQAGEQAGLADAVTAQQGKRTALGNGKRHVVDHHRIAIARAQMLDSEQVGHASKNSVSLSPCMAMFLRYSLAATFCATRVLRRPSSIKPRTGSDALDASSSK